MTKCDNCQQRQATVHMTDISNSEVQDETHLCSQCAESEGLQYNVELDLTDLLPDEIDIEEVKELQKREEELSETTCPNCGITFEEFRNSRQLGCPRDYDLFASALDPLLEKIHGRLEHRGKVPEGAGEAVKINHRIQELERKLQEHIDKEEYEKAAEVRDKIDRLEEEKLEKTTGSETTDGAGEAGESTVEEGESESLEDEVEPSSDGEDE